MNKRAASWLIWIGVIVGLNLVNHYYLHWFAWIL